MKKYYIIIFFLILGIVFRPIFAFAENEAEIDALNQKIEVKKALIKKMEKTIEDYKTEIKKTQLEANSLRNQLDIFDNQIARLKAEIDLKAEKIKEAQLEIDSLKLVISNKEVVITKQKKLISKMIRDINKDQERSYLEILLTHDSFSDFYGQLTYQQRLNDDLGHSVQSLRLAKENLESKKKEIESNKKILENLKIDLENKKQDLTDQSNVKLNLLSQTVYSESKYNTLLANLKTQYQSIENEVRSYEDEVRKKLEAKNSLNNIVDSNSSVMSWPTPSHYITSYFHDPDYPYRNVFEHSGMDLRASQGTPIRATASGYVARARTCSDASCYAYVLIVHTGNLSTLYGHLSVISVSADQFVNRGDIIGYSGGTPGAVGSGPFVTGPHLHFEVRVNGIPVDPLGYLK
jgi:murein DD-endopeptidase MepM/ murein hydrolase activator NlpD